MALNPDRLCQRRVAAMDHLLLHTRWAELNYVQRLITSRFPSAGRSELPMCRCSPVCDTTVGSGLAAVNRRLRLCLRFIGQPSGLLSSAVVSATRALGFTQSASLSAHYFDL